MAMEILTRRMLRVLVMAALAATIALAVIMRLRDPLSSAVIPAEDPYTHMALVRGHLSDGNLDPLHDGGSLYPPGMHSLLAAAYAFTGADLYDIFRVGPAILGGIGILGLALLLHRGDGRVAALVGALALALAPEAIFRTTMMAPTAVDLALLPFLFYALLECMRGRLAWAILAAPLAGFFIVAHPWMLAVVVPAGLALVVLTLVFPWPDRVAGRMSARGAAAVLVTLGLALGTAVFFSYGTGLAFDNIAISGESTGLDRLTLIIAATCAVGAGLLLGFRNRVAAFHSYLARRPLHWSARAGATVAILASVAILTKPALDNGMPEFVDLPRMLGWPILAMATAGLAILPWAPRLTTHMGAALVAVTYPFVIHNPFDSEFWPHRTVAFLAIGLVILAGSAAAAAVRGGARLWHAFSHSQRVRMPALRSLAAATTVSLALTVGLAGTVVAATPDEYEGGWYRLFPECEFEALRGIGETTPADAIVVTGTWQSKLVIAAFSDRPTEVWFSKPLIYDAGHRAETLEWMHADGIDMVIVVDRQLLMDDPDVDLSFLEEDPWVPAGGWCTSAVPEPRVKAYIAEAPA